MGAETPTDPFGMPSLVKACIATSSEVDNKPIQNTARSQNT